MPDNENPLSDDLEIDESTDAEGNETEDSQADTADFWLEQLRISKEISKPYIDSVNDAVNEYLGSTSSDPLVNKSVVRQPEVRFPIFWSSIRTMQPALYSRTPVISSKRMLDNERDNLARLATLMSDRLGKYLIHGTPFDRVLMMTCTDLLLAAKTTNKVCFYDDDYEKDSEEDYGKVKTYWALQDDGQGNQVLINDKGEQLPDGVDVYQNEDQQYYTLDTDPESAKSYIALEPISFKDILHSPQARYWDEVDWLAFKLLLNKKDVTKRFGKKIANALLYSSNLDTAVKDKAKKKQDLQQNYAEIWEVWDRQTKKVRWVAIGYQEQLLDSKDDPYALPGFYPCPPFMLGTIGPDDLYPIPDYIQLKPLILQLHAFAKRLKTLIRATRNRGIFDNSIDELKNLESDLDEAEFIGVANFAQIMNKGGIEQIVQFFPNDKIAATLQLMFQSMQSYETFFNEIYGIPDIIRGVSDPNETAAAQQMKGRYASLRFSSMQREFQRLVRDDIEIMCDMALACFDDSKLREIMGFHYMEPEDQQQFDLALILLKDPTERLVRIDIETDSTIQMNEDEDVQNKTQLASQVMSSFASIAQASQGNPQVMAIGIDLMLLVVRAMKNGNNEEEQIEKYKQQILQPPPPPGPPQPSPDTVLTTQSNEKIAQMKLGAEQQKETMWVQEEQQQNQQNFQAKQLEIQMKQQIAQMDAQLKSMQLQQQQKESAAKIASELQESKAELMKTMQDFEIKKSQLKLDVKNSAESAKFEVIQKKLDAERLALDKRIAAVQAHLDGFNAKLTQHNDKHDRTMAERDHMLKQHEQLLATHENFRNAADQKFQHMHSMIQTVASTNKPQAKSEESKELAAPRRRTYKIHRDKDGELDSVEERSM